MKGYFVRTDKINDLQCDSIERLIKRTAGAHFTDVRIRINGQYEVHEADWIKHMLALPEVDDLTAARMDLAEVRDKLRHANMMLEHYRTRQSDNPNAGKGAEQAKPGGSLADAIKEARGGDAPERPFRPFA